MTDDEATGFQKDRAANALAEILEKFIAKELRPWVATFPNEYYEQLFRLRGLDFPRDSVKRPRYFGHLTNDIIYARLAPKVLEELKSATPRAPDGRVGLALRHDLRRALLALFLTDWQRPDGAADLAGEIDHHEQLEHVSGSPEIYITSIRKRG
jgi:hypothetical protein